MGDPASPSSEMQPLRSNKAQIRKRPERLANWLTTPRQAHQVISSREGDIPACEEQPT